MNERAGVCVAPHMPPPGRCKGNRRASTVEDEWRETWRTGSKLFSTQCQREMQLKMRGEGLWRRHPKRQRFAKVSCDAEGPEGRVWGKKLLISSPWAITAWESELCHAAPPHRSGCCRPICVWQGQCQPLEDVWSCTRWRESAKNLLVRHVFPTVFHPGWRLLSACSPSLPKQLCLWELQLRDPCFAPSLRIAVSSFQLGQS